jgi:ABC-2 type transport system permease protein
MRKILAVARKEFRQAYRDPISLGMLLGIPAMMLLLYGYALNFDVRHVRLGLQDLDRTQASRDFVAGFTHSSYFDLLLDLPAGADPGSYLERGTVRAVIVIPQGYERDLARGRTVEVQLLLDGTDSNLAGTVLGYVRSLAVEANLHLVARSAGSSLMLQAQQAGIDYQPRVWFNPELKSTQFLVPGLIGFILMLTAVVSTALSVVREKERGTMEQLMTTPLRPQQLLLGKTLPYLVISLTATCIILLAARVLFHVVVRGPLLDLFAATLIYLLGALGFGLLISSMVRDQAMAFQAGAVTSMLPAIFLSGFVFPLSAMPAPLQVLSYAVPARYYLIILRGIILKGTGLVPYREQMLFLALYAIVVLGLAWIRLRRAEIG